MTGPAIIRITETLLFGPPKGTVEGSFWTVSTIQRRGSLGSNLIEIDPPPVHLKAGGMMITSLCFVTVAAQRAFYQPGVPVAYLRAVYLTQRGREGAENHTLFLKANKYW